MMAFYEVCSVSHVVQGKKILDEVNCVFFPGKLTAILGPNGAGKSTLLRLLSGELPPTSGRIKLLGEELSKLSTRDLAMRRALMRQNVEVNFPLTSAEIVSMGILSRGAFGSCSVNDPDVERFLSLVDMVPFADQDVRALSGGEKQRVLLARALIQVRNCTLEDPRALLLDEPTAALDLEHQHKTMRLAANFAARGCSVVVVLHDPNLALMYADDVVVLSKGRVVASGVPSETLTPELMRRIFCVDCELILKSGFPVLVVRGPRRDAARADEHSFLQRT